MMPSGSINVMGMHGEGQSADRDSKSRFDTTHWSLVLEAGQQASPDSHEALSALCRIYWYPLYAYVRRRIGDEHEAQDLTQEFFWRLVDKQFISLADPQRGRFRSFLLTAMKHFLINEWNKAKAQKRGGGLHQQPLDMELAESRYTTLPHDELTPERLYERQWALTLLDHVFERLRDEFREAGKERQFEQLKVYIAARSTPTPYTVVARELGMTETAVSVAIHRLRQRYRDLLRWEISQTVPSSDDVEDEIHALFTSLGS